MTTEVIHIRRINMASGKSPTASISDRIGRITVRRLALELLMLIVLTIVVVPESTIIALVPSYSLNHEAIMRLIVVIILLGSLLYISRGIGRTTIAILLYCVLIVAISKHCGHPISNPVGMYIRVASLSLLFDGAFRSRDRELIEAIADALLFICILNLFETVTYGDIFHDIMGKTFLLGFDNGIIVTALPALVLNLLVCFMKGKTICFRSLVSTLVITVTVVITDSSTSTVGFVLFWLALIVLLLSKTIMYLPMDTCKAIVIIPLFIFYWIVLSRLQRYVSNLVVDVLHRDLTFTGRTMIWDMALSKIAESPIIGHGLNPELQRSILYGVSSAHSHILDILYQTGVVGLASYALIVLPFFFSNKSWLRSKGYNTFCMATLMSAIFAFLIMMQFESYSSYISFGLILSLLVVFESFVGDGKRVSRGSNA